MERSHRVDAEAQSLRAARAGERERKGGKISITPAVQLSIPTVENMISFFFCLKVLVRVLLFLCSMAKLPSLLPFPTFLSERKNKGVTT